MIIRETLIYSDQHQSLRLFMLHFLGFLALTLAGESFNQCFVIIIPVPRFSVKLPPSPNLKMML